MTTHTETQEQITPLPWCVTTKRQGHRYIGTEDGTPIAFTATPMAIKSERGEGESWLDAHARTEPLRLAVEAETNANAEYIVRACNSFPALLAALEEARNNLDEAATYLSLRNLGEPARVLFGKLTVATARTHAAIAAAKAP